MDDAAPPYEQHMAERALREMVQNLLRCLSGGEAGNWHSLMPDIYAAAIADQEYRGKTGSALPESVIRGALEWQMDYWKERKDASKQNQLFLEAERHLEEAYCSALRLIAYRISGTPKALQTRAERDFLARLDQREAVIEEVRKAFR